MVLVTLEGCHLLYGLVACLRREAHEKLVWCSGEVIVRGVVLAPQELQRATLVEQDMKDDKWSSHVKVLELEVSTSYGRV